MNTHAFTEEGLRMLLNVTDDEGVKQEIKYALEAFEAADKIADETEHEWANREGKLGDLLAEMEAYMKDEERALVYGAIWGALARIGWIFKGTYILSEGAVVGTGKSIAKLFKKTKEKSLGRQDTKLKELELQIRLKELELKKLELEKNFH